MAGRFRRRFRRRFPRRRKFSRRLKRFSRRKKLSRGGILNARGPKTKSSIIKMPLLLPDRLFVPLKYSQRIVMGTAGSPVVQVFRGNSIYDPDYTGTGTQPMLYDAYSALYSRYRVRASKIFAETFPVTNGVLAGTYNIVLLPTHGVIATSDFDRLREQKYCLASSTNFYKGPFRQSMIFYTDKIWGVNKKAVSCEDGFSSAVNDNPLHVWYWNFVLQAMDGVTSASFTTAFTIIYYCEFYNFIYSQRSEEESGLTPEESNLMEQRIASLEPQNDESSFQEHLSSSQELSLDHKKD